MIIKVNLNNLYILQKNASVLEMQENKKLDFAVEQIVQCVIDESGRLIGIIKDYSRDSANLLDYITYNYTAIVKKDNVDDEVRLAEAILHGTDEYLIPIVDCNNILLYAYQKPNIRIENYMTFISNRFSWTDVLAFVQYEKQFGEVRVCSDMGECEDSIDEYDIANLHDKNVLVCIGFNRDYKAWDVVKKCMEFHVPYKAMIPMSHDRLTCWTDVDNRAEKAFAEIVQRNGKYFDGFDFEQIMQVINQTRYIDGAYVEIGTYRGDSAEAALEYMKQSEIHRQVYLLDTYCGFTYESASETSDALWLDSHTDTSIELVKKRLSKYSNYKCICCNIIEDELPKEIEKIAVCNIDVDMYEAIEHALEKVKNHMVKGGVILAEDFGHTPNLIGGQLAIWQFVEKNHDDFIAIYGKGSQLLLVKK